MKRDSSHVEHEEILRLRGVESDLERSNQLNGELLCMLRHVREDMERAGLPLSHALLSRYKRHAPSALDDASQTKPHFQSEGIRNDREAGCLYLRPTAASVAGLDANDEDFALNDSHFQASRSTRRDATSTLRPCAKPQPRETCSPASLAVLNNGATDTSSDPYKPPVDSSDSQDFVRMGIEPQSRQLGSVTPFGNQTFSDPFDSAIWQQQPQQQHAYSAIQSLSAFDLTGWSFTPQIQDNLYNQSGLLGFTHSSNGAKMVMPTTERNQDVDDCSANSSDAENGQVSFKIWTCHDGVGSSLSREMANLSIRRYDNVSDLKSPVEVV